jgi:hypothetical protein
MAHVMESPLAREGVVSYRETALTTGTTVTLRAWVALVVRKRHADECRELFEYIDRLPCAKLYSRSDLEKYCEPRPGCPASWRAISRCWMQHGQPSCSSDVAFLLITPMECGVVVDPAHPVQPPDPRALCADAGEPFEED